MTDGSEHIALTNDAQQTANIIISLQELLAELDKRDLSVPAIKIAEAIDCLAQP